MLGSTSTHARLMSSLAAAAGAHALGLDYTLAPESNHAGMLLEVGGGASLTPA